MSEEMVIIQDEIIKQQEVVVKTADEYIRALTEMNGLLSEKSQDSKQRESRLPKQAETQDEARR